MWGVFACLLVRVAARRHPAHWCKVYASSRTAHDLCTNSLHEHCKCPPCFPLHCLPCPVLHVCARVCVCASCALCCTCACLQDLAKTIERAGKSINFLRDACGDSQWVHDWAPAAAQAAAALGYGQVCVPVSVLLPRRCVEFLSGCECRTPSAPAAPLRPVFVWACGTDAASTSAPHNIRQHCEQVVTVGMSAAMLLCCLQLPVLERVVVSASRSVDARLMAVLRSTGEWDRHCSAVRRYLLLGQVRRAR